MSRDWEQKLVGMQEVALRFRGPELPRCCPGCGARLAWGWMEEELWAPCEPDAVHLHRIPRPDQTVFCPRCEECILK